ncbi:MAG: hypothetical protein HY720_04005 [Planctomycetes bacterium]|nr:hypothetical protein [Planctomycetota bacterium]
MKLKFRCRCQQKLRAPVSRIGRTITCASCAAEVVVPPATDPQVIEITCRCETAVEPAKRFCPGCGLDVVEAIEGVLRELPVASAEGEEGGGKEMAPPGGPIEIPPGFTLYDKALVKFFCACGKKVRLKYKQKKDPGVCPRCKALLVFPDVTREPTVTVLCSCEAPFPKGEPELASATPDRACRACGKKLLIEETPPLPPPLASPPGCVPDLSPALAPEGGPQPPVAPALARAPAPAPAAPVPTPPPSQLETSPLAAPDNAVAGVSDRASQRRRMQKAKMGAVAVFLVGLGLLVAAMIWFFRGGEAGGDPDASSPETKKNPSDPGVSWDPSNPLDPSQGEGKEDGAVEDPFSDDTDDSSGGGGGSGEPDPGGRDPEPQGDPERPDPHADPEDPG